MLNFLLGLIVGYFYRGVKTTKQQPKAAYPMPGYYHQQKLPQQPLVGVYPGST